MNLDITLITLSKEFKRLDMSTKNMLLNLFKQLPRNKDKINYTNPIFNYEIVFKEGAVDEILKIKGWKSCAEMARNMGLTRAYICNLRKRKAACTHTVITRTAALLGNTYGAWWIHFEMIPTGIISPNEPQWNQEKYKGMIPYSKNSIAVEVRKMDYETEKV